jgi:hypothetical protein
MILNGRLIGFLFLFLSACSVDPLEVGSITVTIEADELLVSPTVPGTFRVRATNPTGARVDWGQGSSSCQLTLYVISEAGVRREAGARACTTDLVTQGLDGLQSRTEVFEWGGSAVVDGEIQQLPPGTYRLVGSAGDKGESQTVDVELAAL